MEFALESDRQSMEPPCPQPRQGVLSLVNLPAVLLALLAVQSSPVVHAVTPVPTWKDSYSAGDQCYCDSNYDHDIADVMISTPQGDRTVVQVCEAIGPGPGAEGRPVYNDIQCGNGPANSSADETVCPGRVDMGEAGCSEIGPRWNLDRYFPAPIDIELTETAPPVADTPEGTIYEAEDTDSRAGNWMIIHSDDGRLRGVHDNDPPHLEFAGNGRYLESLPLDTETVADATAEWATPGAGPKLLYRINVDQPGRYLLLVRALSTTDTDVGVHAGLDGQWPDALANITLCGEQRHWAWSDCSTQSEAVPLKEDTVFEISSAGEHELRFAARDVGFQLDQFLLRYIGELPITEPEPDPDPEPDPEPEPAPEPQAAAAISVGGGSVAAVAAMNALSLCAGLLLLMARCIPRRRRSH